MAEKDLLIELEKALKNYLANVSGTQAVFIATLDGHLLLEKSIEKYPFEHVAPMAGSVLGISETLASQLLQQKLEDNIIIMDKHALGLLKIHDKEDSLFLGVLCSHSVSLGKMLSFGKIAIKEINEALEEQEGEDSDAPKRDDLTVFRRFSSLCEFFWVLPKKLGGMRKPGLLTDTDDDLGIMKQLGVNVLVTLQLTPMDTTLLKQYDIEGIHFPIVDMDVPSLEETYAFVARMQPLLDDGKSIVYHCKAGMGRTGTLLACNLLWLENISAILAIEKIRAINHRYIQTDAQLEFVGQFEQYVKQKESV